MQGEMPEGCASERAVDGGKGYPFAILLSHGHPFCPRGMSANYRRATVEAVEAVIGVADDGGKRRSGPCRFGVRFSIR